MRRLAGSCIVALIVGLAGAQATTGHTSDYYAGEFVPEARCVHADTTCFAVPQNGVVSLSIVDDGLGTPPVLTGIAAYVHFRQGAVDDPAYGPLADNGQCGRTLGLPYWTFPQQTRPQCRGGEHYICGSTEYVLRGWDQADSVVYVTLLPAPLAVATCADRVPVFQAPVPSVVGPTDGHVYATISAS